MIRLVIVLALVAAALGGTYHWMGRSDAPVTVSTEPGANGEWLEDIAQARSLAARLRRPILMFFLGSDWCLWCRRLEKETFSQPAWKAHAAGRYVLMKIDFPRKIQQAEALKKQNSELHDLYKIEHRLPAVIITDATGKEQGRTGYFPGGPELYIEELRRALDPNDPSKGPQIKP